MSPVPTGQSDMEAEDAEVEPPRSAQRKWVVSNAVVEDSQFLEDVRPALPADLATHMRKCGLSKLFPIQIETIPLIYKWCHTTNSCLADLCISSPTGSGKTLCYVLPLVHSLKCYSPGFLSALIIAPTTDLATQIHDEFQRYMGDRRLRVALLTGESRFSEELKKLYRKKHDRLISNCDVVIATPGRLLDHMRSFYGRSFQLKYLRFLILDEADQLLADPQLEWWEELSMLLSESSTFRRDERDGRRPFEMPSSSRKRMTVSAARSSIDVMLSWTMPFQKILLSATMCYNVDLLKRMDIEEPLVYYTSPKPSAWKLAEGFCFPDNLRHCQIACEDLDKPLVLSALLKQRVKRRVLCFTETKMHSKRLRQLLELMGHHDVCELSKNVTKEKRRNVCRRFETKEVSTLICTNMMARGMNFEDVVLVVCYDAPWTFEDYAHISGRTARAGRSGLVISLLNESERNRTMKDDTQFSLAEFAEKYEFDFEALEPARADYAKALSALKAESN